MWTATSLPNRSLAAIIKFSAESRTEITDTVFLRSLDERLRRTHESPPCLISQDTRIVMVLHRHGGETDALSFGGIDMTYNRGCYQVDTTLLTFVAERIGPKYMEDVRGC